MHAIIETGGKQYKVTEGDTLFIEKLASEAGENVTFDKVLAVIDGDKITVGTPVVEGAKVDASVVKNGKGKKVIVFKYKPKKGYRRRKPRVNQWARFRARWWVSRWCFPRYLSRWPSSAVLPVRFTVSSRSLSFPRWRCRYWWH